MLPFITPPIPWVVVPVGFGVMWVDSVPIPLATLGADAVSESQG